MRNFSTETLKLLFQSKTQGFLIVKPLTIIYDWGEELHQEHDCCRKIVNVAETQDDKKQTFYILHSGLQKQETSKKSDFNTGVQIASPPPHPPKSLFDNCLVKIIRFRHKIAPITSSQSAVHHTRQCCAQTK